ncbi:MAG: GTPase Era [Alphaproteobacteria bacterium]|nr:GTPase Era [Alphaproteobacteria bacterium]MDA7988478.1 GTPase Era [Alphaproteobacteria bacterium]
MKSHSDTDGDNNGAANSPVKSRINDDNESSPRYQPAKSRTDKKGAAKGDSDPAANSPIKSRINDDNEGSPRYQPAGSQIDKEGDGNDESVKIHHDNNSRAGLVALLGPTNAGKSLLLNTLVGDSLSIVSHKRQTTRFAVRAVWTENNTQAVFIDVPGFLDKPRRLLERTMRASSSAALDESDLALLVIDSSHPPGPDEHRAIKILRDRHRNVILVLNKIDLVPKESLLGIAAQLSQSGDFRAVTMISAKTGDGLDGLRARITSLLPRRPFLLPAAAAAADTPLDSVALAEITRGVIYSRLHQELPYATAVETTESVRKGKVLVVSQTIHVERDSQKGMVIGAGGQMLGTIRELSQSAMSLRADARVRLRLYVRVSPDWAQSADDLSRLLPR